MKHQPSRRLPRLLGPALAAALACSAQAQGAAPVQARQGEPQQVQPQPGQVQPQRRQMQIQVQQPGWQAANGPVGTSWARQQSLRASRVIGSEVRNPQGQEIGQIEDMVLNLDNGKARYAVLRFDPGWLQFERVYAIPVEKLRMVDDQVVVDIPKQRLEQSGIEADGWGKDYFQDRTRIARLDSDWGLGQRAPEQLVRASDLMNSPIVSAGGDRIGSIEEIVFAPGRQQVQYVVVAFDRGWLGTNKRVAVDLGSLHRSSRDDALALVADRATVTGMRPFTQDRYAYFGNGDFVNRESRRALGGPAAYPAR